MGYWLADVPPGEQPSAPFFEHEATPKDDLHRMMTEGAFREQPFWPIGPITVTLRMLEDIDVTKGGWVTIADLICFNYPNITCLWTQLKFLDRHPELQDCECDVHVLTGDSVLTQLGM